MSVTIEKGTKKNIKKNFKFLNFQRFVQAAWLRQHCKKLDLCKYVSNKIESYQKCLYKQLIIFILRFWGWNQCEVRNIKVRLFHLSFQQRTISSPPWTNQTEMCLIQKRVFWSIIQQFLNLRSELSFWILNTHILTLTV